MTTRDHIVDAPFAPGAAGVHVETWGTGTPVVLVHGSLATGVAEWEAQRPLAEAGYSLRVVDRRGYGRSASAAGEDFLVDAEDVAELLGDGAHLVGHSYGGLVAMFAAARRPEATLSLTLLEPAAGAAAEHDTDWRQLVAEVRDLWGQALPDHDWVVRFLKAVGSDPDQFPPEMLAEALPLVPLFRQGRPFYEAQLPLAELAVAGFPSSSSRVATIAGSTPCASTWPLASAVSTPSSKVPATRSSSSASPSTRCSSSSGSPPVPPPPPRPDALPASAGRLIVALWRALVS